MKFIKMRINLNDKLNQKQIEGIRSQITSKMDLKKFDQFLAENDSFDFSDENDMAAARGCCGGDKCCVITIGIESLRMQ